MTPADVPLPKVPGEDAPEGFTRNEVTIYKGYFCRFMCQQERDNFNEEQVFMNEQFRANARALFNKEGEEGFHSALYNNDADYSRLAEFVLKNLVSRGLLEREEKPDREPTYWRTQKLRELCPKILASDLPVIDSLVDDYDKLQGITQSNQKKVRP
jgi:hypothetical protein